MKGTSSRRGGLFRFQTCEYSGSICPEASLRGKNWGDVTSPNATKSMNLKLSEKDFACAGFKPLLISDSRGVNWDAATILVVVTPAPAGRMSHSLEGVARKSVARFCSGPNPYRPSRTDL